MKKVLIGCGAALMLGGLLLGGVILWGAKVFKDVAGDVVNAAQVVLQTPLDRIEQEAVDVPAAEVRGRLAEINGRFVRVRGVVSDKQMAPQPGQLPMPTGQQAQVNPMMLLEPAVLVLGASDTFAVKDFPPGTRVEVLGVGSRLNLAATPGADEQARKQWESVFGSASEAPVVVAKRVVALEAAKDAGPVDAAHP